MMTTSRSNNNETHTDKSFPDTTHIYMTIDDVVGYLRVKSKSTIYRWMDNKDFPKPNKLGGLVRWDMREVAKWAATRKGT